MVPGWSPADQAPSCFDSLPADGSSTGGGIAIDAAGLTWACIP